MGSIVGSIANWMCIMRSCMSHRRSENDHSSLVDELETHKYRKESPLTYLRPSYRVLGFVHRR